MLPWLTSVRHSSTRLSANLPTRAQTALCHLSSSGIGAQQLPNRNLAHKLGNVENSGDSDCVILTNTEPQFIKCQLIAIFFFREVFPASAHLSMPYPPLAARLGCLFLVKIGRIHASPAVRDRRRK